jgi:ABC-2 type transport system permease protein
MLYLFPLVFASLMGALMGRINPLFIQRMIPSMAVFTMMCSALLSLPTSMVSARANGIWRAYKINAVSRSAILVVPVVALGLHGLVVTALVALWGSLAFGAPLPADPFGFAVAWLASWFAISALGTLIGTMASNERVALLFSQLLYIHSIMLGGLMMPSSSMGEELRIVSLVFPATHAMRAFESPLGVLPLLILVGIAAVAWALTLLRFRWDAPRS